MMLLLWLGLAEAGTARVVRAGETVESVAASYGDPALAVEIRRRNALGPTEQPRIGTVLDLPDRLADGDCKASYVLGHRGTGTVRVPGEAALRPLANHEPLPSGATVCTGADSFARIHLAVSFDERDHDAIVLLPDTCVTLRASHRVQGRRTSLVELGGGSVRVEERPGAGEVVVRTGDGLSLGEGGGFRVVQEPTATRTEAVAAEVLTLAAGNQVALPEGFGNRTPRGSAPGAPVRLPDAITLLAPAEGAPLLRPDFLWTESPVALGYFVEMALGPDFGAQVNRVRVPSDAWLPDELFLPSVEGGLWWRVTCFDLAGFEGIPSEARRFLVPDWGLR